jgi:hypothetical protein
MNRYFRNTVIQAKIETTYGTDPGSYAATDCLLISDARFEIDRDVVPRNLIRGYMGGSDQLMGTRRANITFTVELAGAGAAGTAPAWGKLLRMCGMAEAITVGARVEYTPVSTSFASATLRYFIDGVMYVSRGCRGTAKLKMNAYDRPVIEFTLQGFDTNAQELATPSPTLTAWKRPQVVTDGNSGDIVLGGTYATGTVTVGSGAVLKSRGLEIDIGNTVSHLKMLGGEAIEITDRETTGKMSVELTAAEEVTWRTDINANTLTTLAFRHGSAAGSQIIVWAPAIQRVAPQMEDYEGAVLMATELRLLPSSGNDELTIVVK